MHPLSYRKVIQKRGESQRIFWLSRTSICRLHLVTLNWGLIYTVFNLSDVAARI